MLKVPVHMAVTGQNLLIVGGGGFDTIPFPVKPFTIFEVQGNPPGSEPVHVIGENRDTRILRKHIDELPYNEFTQGRLKFTRPKFDYLQSLYEEFPDVIFDIMQGEIIEPYPIFLDIETTGLNWENDEILSVQISYSDYDDEIFLYRNSETSEEAIIRETIELCKKSPSGKIPDIMVNYNGNRFDIPFLRGRAEKNRIISVWNTMDMVAGDVYNQAWLQNRIDDEIHEIAKGFRSYDMYLNAFSDLKLAKLPSRTQKNVARYYGCQEVFDIEKSEKVTMDDLLSTNRERFEKYARSDIKQLKYLWNVYSIRTTAEANIMKVPFMTAHAMSSGQKSYLPLYREARRSGYYGLTTNNERYSDLYQKGKYQGAIVGSWAHGYYDKIIYVDAHAMYPSIMETFNLSPDRCKLVDIILYDEWNEPDHGMKDIRAEGTADAKIIYIPDDNYKVVFKFQVDLINDGYMRNIVRYYDKIRTEYKKEMKKHSKDSPEYLQYDSMQGAAKVINNTYYGVNGNKYYKIGDLSYAVFTTAIGRWCMTELIKFFGGTEEYPKEDGSWGDTVLETDTDGLMIRVDSLRQLETGDIEVTTGDSIYTIHDINNYIQQRMIDFFSIPEDKLNFIMEFENAGSIYVYKKKNYILRADADGGKLTIKGSAFVGYDKAPIIKRAVEIMANCVMYNDRPYDEAVRMCRDMNQPLEMFMFTKTLKQDTEDYKGFQSIDTYINHIDHKYGTKAAFIDMKRRANMWLDLKLKRDGGKDQKEQYKIYKNLIKDAENEEELMIIMNIISETVTGTDKKLGNYYLISLVMAYRQKGVRLKKHDVLEYYMSNTKDGFSIADEVHSINDIDVNRYLVEINRIIERFEYANPIHKELSLW